jgi:voltage-gated potassium channel
MATALQRKVHQFLDPDHRDTGTEKVVHGFIIILILLNVIVVSMETIHPLYKSYYKWFHAFDLFTIVVFSIEYVLRVWSCTAMEKYRHPVLGRLRYMLSFAALIDLLAIFPFYLPLVIGVDLRSIRVLSLFRFLKMGRYFKAARVISTVIKEKKNELTLSLLLMIGLIIVSSTVMYYLERDGQPETFSSIPATMWWGVTTLTTLGYGDVVPKSMAGKIVTGFSLIFSIAMFAIPAGILASGFSEAFHKRKANRRCPNCGEPIDETT